MKILHITTCDWGGAGLCCLRIHQSLIDCGIDSKVVTIHNTMHVPEEYEFGHLKDIMTRAFTKGLRMIGVKLTDRNKTVLLSKKYQTLYSLPTSTINLAKCEWVEWADIIHLHWVNNYLDYLSFFRKVKKPIVWTLHDENFFFGIAHYSDALLANHPLEIKSTRIKHEALSCVENLSVIMLSEFFYNKFKGHELLIGRNVKVINNPINTYDFKPIDKKEARMKLGVSEKDIVIGFTSLNISDNRKGLKVLLQVVSELNNPRMKILAIGENTNDLIEPNLISVGLRNSPKDISEALSACDFFAMPSYQEAFAQSPMEAMACGLPVVVFPVSGTSELVNERNGIVCDDFTPGALRKGIEMLMSRKYSASEIRQDMINRFSLNTIAMKYVSLYNEIIGKTVTD